MENQYIYSAKEKVLLNIFSIDIVGNKMEPGNILHEEQCLVSENGAYYLKMQKDGNLVLYKSSHFHHKNAKWSTKTHDKGKSPFYLIFQKTGILEVISQTSKSLWKSSLEHRGIEPFHLTLQSDGNLVVYDKDKKALWSTKTYLSDSE